MRIIAVIAVAVIAFAVRTFAAPSLAVDIVATQYYYAKMGDYPKASKVIAKIYRLTESGQPVTLRAAGNEFTVTPKLLRNGSVSYSEVVLMHYDSRKPLKRALPKRKPVPIGSPLEVRVCVGLVDFATRTSIPK